MKIAVFGSTDLTASVLKTLGDVGFPPELIITVGESFPISYAQNESRSVKNFRFHDIRSVTDEAATAWIKFYDNKQLFRELNSYACKNPLDLAIVAGWYHMVPEDIRSLFRLGCVGIHASKLPKLRGGAPLNWAILNGYKETGVSLFELTNDIDDGALWDQEVFSIGPRDTIKTLIDRSHKATAKMIKRTIPRAAEGILNTKKQVGAPSYGLQRKPEDGEIDWTLGSADIDRLVRAVTRPYPGAYSFLNGRKIYVWRTQPLEEEIKIFGSFGQIFIDGSRSILVVTGNGIISIEEASDDAGQCMLKALRSSNMQRFSPSNLNVKEFIHP